MELIELKAKKVCTMLTNWSEWLKLTYLQARLF